jgi:hypothetical protein
MSLEAEALSRTRLAGLWLLLAFFSTATVYTGYTVFRYYFAIFQGRKNFSLAMGAFSVVLTCGVVIGTVICTGWMIGLLRYALRKEPIQPPVPTRGNGT